MITTEIHTRDIPDIYHRFEKEIGAKYWRNRVRQCKAAIRGNMFLGDYLRREHDIAFQLDHLADLANKYDRIPVQVIEKRAIYPAASFAAQILSLLDASSKEEAQRLRRRVHGAFNNPDDMRGLCLELSVATHFTLAGKNVSWPEPNGAPVFDLLVEDAGEGGLEVEIKSISNDKGRKIHEREALDFYALAKPYLDFTRNLKKGLSVVLTLPERLPTAVKERQELAKQVAHAIYGGVSCELPNGASVRIKDFDPQALGLDFSDQREIRRIVDSVTETNNRRSMIIGSPGGGVLAFTIESAQDDNLIKAMFDTLSDAARRQLSGTRAGLLIASLDGLDAAQLRSLGLQDELSGSPPTGLRVGVSKFLNSSERNHVVGVGFVSRSGIASDVGGTISTGGAAYYFHKADSTFWTDEFKGLFSWEVESERAPDESLPTAHMIQ
jgi:hypothetical protein